MGVKSGAGGTVTLVEDKGGPVEDKGGLRAFQRSRNFGARGVPLAMTLVTLFSRKRIDDSLHTEMCRDGRGGHTP